METKYGHCCSTSNGAGCSRLANTGGRFLAAMALLAFSPAANGAREAGGMLTIARRGKAADCTVVTPANPSPCIRHAAEEFAKYVRQMTGVSLPVADSAPDGAKTVRLVSGQGLGRDAFRLRVQDGSLLIAGDDDRATLFGVYDFLENQCGCDWVAHDQDIVPRRDAIALPEGFDVLRRPAFAVRETTYADVCQRPDFAAKMKLNGYIFARSTGWKDIHGGKPSEQFDTWLGKCHTFLRLLPPERHFKDHPEWYSEVNGKRNGERRTQLCLTNPEVVARATEAVMDRIAKVYPAVKVFGVSQSDAWSYCQCTNCAALDAHEGSHAGSNIAFVNQIAEAVARKYPDVTIETLAYEYTRKPPRNVKPRENVMICLCTDTCDFSRPLTETRFRFKDENDFVEDLRAWCAMAKRVHVWDYTMNFRYKLHAFPNIYSLKPNLETFLDAGVTEVFEQGPAPSVHQAGTALKGYLASHLLWDPRQPLEPLLARFYAGYYGAAAPWMRLYMEELHAVSRARDETKDPMMMWGRIDSPALRTEFFERGATYLARAAQAVAQDPVRLRNVQWEQNANDYTRIMRANDICRYAISRKGGYPVSPHIVELQNAARRILADWKAVPQAANVSEEEAIRRQSREKLERYASFDPAKAAMGATLEIPAGALFGDIGKGSVRLWFSDVRADAGEKYRMAVRIRCETNPSAKPGDEAFRIWAKGRPDTGRIIDVAHLRTDADGYGWYELRNTLPIDPDGFFIVQAGKAGKLTVDKMRIAFADMPPSN